MILFSFFLKGIYKRNLLTCSDRNLPVFYTFNKTKTLEILVVYG